MEHQQQRRKPSSHASSFKKVGTKWMKSLQPLQMYCRESSRVEHHEAEMNGLRMQSAPLFYFIVCTCTTRPTRTVAIILMINSSLSLQLTAHLASFGFGDESY
mmetsp:Transcript_42401/g.102137  ORF Transcript_42401/g.102137 Transcript_42401/m.102137 type:complete len:103 (-) Transcript_42401:1716-2024(-)